MWSEAIVKSVLIGWQICPGSPVGLLADRPVNRQAVPSCAAAVGSRFIVRRGKADPSPHRPVWNGHRGRRLRHIDRPPSYQAASPSQPLVLCCYTTFAAEAPLPATHGGLDDARS